jgi:hypothetical protein
MDKALLLQLGSMTFRQHRPYSRRTDAKKLAIQASRGFAAAQMTRCVNASPKFAGPV